jgi:hypothetical protein
MNSFYITPMERREGMFNVHNGNLCARDNPHVTREHGYQVRFSVGVWAGIAGNIFMGPYLVPDRLASEWYRDFLVTVPPGLPEDVPPAVRQNAAIRGKMSSSE